MNKKELIEKIILLTLELNKAKKELSEICQKEIQPLIDNKEYIKAKEYVFDFYRNCVNEIGNGKSQEKDMILEELDRLIKSSNNFCFRDNWSGDIHYFDTLEEVKEAAKKETGDSITIYDNNGVVCITPASGFTPA